MTATIGREPSRVRSIGTSFGHKGFALIGAAFVVFEVLFVTLLAGSFWFSLTLRPLSIPAILLALAIAYFALKALESRLICQKLRFVLGGKPPVIFLKWAETDDAGLRYGAKRVLWSAIDEVDLTFFGNLLFRSRALCGEEHRSGKSDLNPSDLIMKMPLSVITQADQNAFMAQLRSHRPALKENERLRQRLNQPYLKNVAFVQGLSVIFLLVMLFDVGYSTFAYLDTLKEYHLTRVEALKGDFEAAKKHFALAEDIRLHPLPISWVTHKLTQVGGVNDMYQEARIDALWSIKQTGEAIEVARQLAENSPKAFRTNLRLVRLYAELKNDKAAVDEAQKAIDKRDDALLPQLYMQTLLKRERKNDQFATKTIDQYFKKLDDDIFGEEPLWPPGGDRFLTDVWYHDDLRFVFQPPPNP